MYAKDIQEFPFVVFVSDEWFDSVYNTMNDDEILKWRYVGIKQDYPAKHRKDQ